MNKLKRYNLDDEIYDFFVPIGGSLDFCGVDLPYGFLYEDGAHVSKNTYPILYSRLTKVKGLSTSELSTTALFTLAGHGMETGDKMAFTATTGELPTGISLFTTYYLIWVSANTFRVASTYADAIAGTPVPIGTTAGVGNHTVLYCPWGIYDAFDFYLPDSRGLVSVGAGQQGRVTWASSEYKEQLGQYKQDTFETHQHGQDGYSGGTNWGWSGKTYSISGFIGTADWPVQLVSPPWTGRVSSKTAPARVGKHKIIRAY